MALNVAETSYGVLKGIPRGEDVTVFKGIPFAKPPIGGLRWRRPLPPEPWTGIRMADKFGPMPPQGGSLNLPRPRREYEDEEDVSESEDCLYLNIWTPAENPEEKLPVMLWIPGGGFMTGNGADRTFYGDTLCGKGVILVTVMHRVGPLGFMSHPELTDENGHSGNYALYDVIAAVEWVWNNIAAFGGDRDRITVAGQSSGEVAVQVLLQVPRLRGKIRRAIMQSGRALESGDLMDTAESSLKKGIALMEAMGAETAEDMRLLEADVLWKALRDARKPQYDENGVFLSEQDNPGRMLYHVDGEAMLELLDEAGINGLNMDVDILIGSCADESGGDSPRIRANSCIAWAKNQLKLAYQPSFIYMFARRRPDDPRGAAHSAELQYQFGTLEGSWRNFTPEDYALSELIVSYWTNFVKTGDPNGEGLPQWRPYTHEHPVRMRLDVESCEEIV